MTERHTWATGKHSTNFKVATEALQKAATEIRDNPSQTKPNVGIFTDALSVLYKLKNPCQEDLNKVSTALVDLRRIANACLKARVAR